MSNRFDLETALAAWRRSLTFNRAFDVADLDELERHVRDQVEALARRGVPQEEAFHRALGEIGSYGAVEEEYRKVYWGKRRRRGEVLDAISLRLSMLKNYLKIAYRNLHRQKGYAFINITGLAVGITACLLIALYVLDELSYDRFHEKASRIYQVVSTHRFNEHVPLDPEAFQALGSAAIAPALETDFPEVLRTVRFSGHKSFVFEHAGRHFREDHFFIADSSVFDVFSFPLLAGDPRTALSEPFSIVMTEAAARKYFGDDDPMGKTLVADIGATFTVRGILSDVPRRSHLDFDMLLSMSTFREFRPGVFQDWFHADFYTYVLLPEGYDKSALEARLPDFVKRHVGTALREPDESYSMALKPLTDVYLHSAGGPPPGVIGNRSNLYVFVGAALFILLTAGLNFVTLATARSSERAKEVGVRKVVGAHRSGLAAQFLIESTFLSMIAVLLAVLLTVAALPAFRAFSGKAFSTGDVAPVLVLVLLGLGIIIGVLAGGYPAFVLSSFRPSSVLKGGLPASERGVVLRKGLVVLQFGISIVLIAATGVANSQIGYMQGKDLGFHKNQMLVIDFGGDQSVQARYETVKQALQAHPAVISATASRSVPGTRSPEAATLIETMEGEKRQVDLSLYTVDHDFIDHYGIGLIAGRGFTRRFPSDVEEALVVNEAVVRHLDFTQPEQAVGKKFEQWGRTGTIIGVVKDFHFRSLHEQVAPLSMRIRPREFTYLSLQVETDDLRQTIADVEGIWQRLAPETPFVYSFLDDLFNSQYQHEKRLTDLTSTFAGLAIAIACLGLFSLAAFTAERRTKEVGVRKVLGASISSIVMLLSKDFLKLVLAAFVMAGPLVYFGMQQWLDNFAYRIAMGPGAFLITGGSVVLIALLTVSYQAAKAALADPVKSLRYE